MSTDARYGRYAALLLAGFALRVGVALASRGTNDIHTWEGFGAAIAHAGLLGHYGEIRVDGFPMNHPPLAAYYAVGVRALASGLELPFALIFKLPMIAADVAIAAALGWVAGRDRRPSLALTAAYALSPLGVLISAYHGNTDCAATALALAAALLLTRGFPAAAGLALAAAMNVKLIPILLLPALLLQCRDTRAAGRFAAALALGLLPFLPFVAAQPLAFYQATLGRGSELNLWGLTAFFYAGLEATASPIWLQRIASIYLGYGLYLFLGLITLVSLLGRLRHWWNPFSLCAASFAIFLTLAPGFAVQYLVYALPFLLLVDFRSGLAYSVLAGVFAGVVYASYWTGSFPFYSHFHGGFPMPAALVGLLAWGVLVGFLLRRFPQLRRENAAEMPS